MFCRASSGFISLTPTKSSADPGLTGGGAYSTCRSAPRVDNVVIANRAFGTIDDIPIILLQNAFFCSLGHPTLPHDFNIFGNALSFFKLSPYFLIGALEKYIIRPGKPRLRKRVLSDGCVRLNG